MQARRPHYGEDTMFEVIDAGLETRIVDFGRPRSRSLGVPVGGAADRASFVLANTLIGNSPDTAGIEIAVKGPILRTDRDIACAVVGAPFAMSVGNRQLAGNGIFPLSAGDGLVISGTPRGMRAYLCVPGGFSVREIMHSRSGLTPLRAGDRLECESKRNTPRRLSDECPIPTLTNEWKLRAIAGPQMDWFDPAAFFDRSFVVSPASNRMGVRLDGVLLPATREMVSEPVCPGCVQITREGQPIVLGVDGQTIGGYPKIAVVCDADIDALGQVRPGDRVIFQRIELDDAARAMRERRAVLGEWMTRIRISLDAPKHAG